MYIKTGRAIRQSGIVGILKLDSGRSNLISEIAFPPLGYVMTIDSPPPDERLFDISYFANYNYNELSTVFLKLPVLPVHLEQFPGDYRTIKQIMDDEKKNEIDAKLFYALESSLHIRRNL